MFLRIVEGVAEHFPVRVGEWIMAASMIAWAWVVWLEPDTFERSTTLTMLARIADPQMWSTICVTAGFTRLIALLINGTFRQRFKYSAHLRGLAALLACFIWGQITLQILVGYMRFDGILIGAVPYGTLMLLDMWNLFRAWADVGHFKIDPG